MRFLDLVHRGRENWLSMEKFLQFWSHYNAAIIETLVALILISAIYLAYRTFFGAKGADTFDAVGGGGGASTAQIEKTLQRILDQQQSGIKAVGSIHEGGAGASAGGGAPEELVQELVLTKKALEEKEKQIVGLQEKAAEAAKAARSSAGGPSAQDIAAAASAAAGLAEKERFDYEAKIKELEARLAEYEIISEDIADLSFFKEENARLTKELEILRGGDGGVPIAPVPAAAPVAPAEAANAIDDSLMAEFAAAVEGQKIGTPESAPKADENEKLLTEFENFNKKS
jgi:hypothetical protein